MGLFSKKKTNGLMDSEASSSDSLGNIDFSWKEIMKSALKSSPEDVLKTLVGTGFSTVTGIPLLSPLLNLKSLKVTSKRLKNLKSLVFEECSCKHCDSLLNYAIAQKAKKVKSKAKSSVPIYSYTETVKKLIHHFTKHDQGGERMAVAKTLWSFASIDNALQYASIQQAQVQCDMANSIISVLVFNDVSGKSYFKTLGLVSDKKGILVIAAALKSV